MVIEIIEILKLGGVGHHLKTSTDIRKRRARWANEKSCDYLQ
jgi:hypothetical protein